MHLFLCFTAHCNIHNSCNPYIWWARGYAPRISLFWFPALGPLHFWGLGWGTGIFPEILQERGSGPTSHARCWCWACFRCSWSIPGCWGCWGGGSGPGATVAITLLLPPSPEDNSLIQHLGKLCHFLIFFSQRKSWKKWSMGVRSVFVTFLFQLTKRRWLCARPGERVGCKELNPCGCHNPLPMHRGEGFTFCRERPAFPFLFFIFLFFKLIFFSFFFFFSCFCFPFYIFFIPFYFFLLFLFSFFFFQFCI